MADMMGQVALVTGGIRGGIGLAIWERLINRGVRIAAGYPSNQDAAQASRDKHAGQSLTIHQGNIGSNEDCLRVIDRALDAHGQLDVLVNNVGITVDKAVRKMTPALWDRVIRVNPVGGVLPVAGDLAAHARPGLWPDRQHLLGDRLGQRIRPGQLCRQVRHVRADDESWPALQVISRELWQATAPGGTLGGGPGPGPLSPTPLSTHLS
jgi:NAD(P)-dependent dehydrogenase (short-subunit alcohol dehydrogenase family)